MCGIVIYKGEEIPKTQILNYAILNKHRGDEDGFGYMDFSSNKLFRTVLSFEEICDGKIDDKRKDKKGMNTRLTIARKELKKDTKFIAFHHRKASCGSVKTVNTHPIKVKKDIYYMHNGTIEDYWLFRNYMKLLHKKKYVGATDTEVIGKYVEDYLKDNNLVETQEHMVDLFQGFGVVVRIDKAKKEMIIFKDWARTLYMYKLGKNYLFISEPLFSIKDFDYCLRIESGVIKITEKQVKFIKSKFVNVTKRIKRFIDMEINEFCCDGCKNGSGNTVRFDGTSYKDYCLCCLTSGRKLENVDKITKKVEYEKKESINNIGSYDYNGQLIEDDYYNKRGMLDYMG